VELKVQEGDTPVEGIWEGVWYFDSSGDMVMNVQLKTHLVGTRDNAFWVDILHKKQV